MPTALAPSNTTHEIYSIQSADAIALDYIHSPSFVSAYLQWTVMVGQSYTEPGLADHRVPPPARAVARPDTLPQIVSTKEGGECIKEAINYSGAHMFEGSRDWVTTNWVRKESIMPFQGSQESGNVPSESAQHYLPRPLSDARAFSLASSHCTSVGIQLPYVYTAQI
ncbi:hypothetical protein B0H14DRAFT_3162343 [Mycena olivaceomarginata]|nr:hypothetical protein B0H14DRAFT_3162343 [Mycena olivaceomarginata]